MTTREEAMQTEATHRAYLEAAYRQLLGKALDARRGGFDAWAVQSTGERVAVALVLNRPEWLASMGYTLAEAIERTGEDWLTVLPRAARAVASLPLVTE